METREGTLVVTKWLRPRGNGRLTIGSMLADLVDPRFDLGVILVAGELIAPNRHEYVYGIRGKGAVGITKDDDGRPARVTGQLKMNESGSYGEFTRATVEFLDAEVSA